MPGTILRTTLLALLSATPCLGQTSYNGLVPGRSSRSEVAGVLGQPIGTGTATQLEYQHPENFQSLSVRYRDGVSPMESLQIVLLFPALRPGVLQYFGLPERADGLSRDSQGKLVEYFGAPKYLALTYAGADAESGIRTVVMHSPGSYQRAASAAGAPGSVAQAPSAPQAPPVFPPAGAAPPSSQAPGAASTMSVIYQPLPLAHDECMRRAERALGVEGYRIDVVRKPRYILASKLVFGGVIMCEEAPSGQEWVNVIVSAPSADRVAAERERGILLQHMTEGVTAATTPAPAPAPAPAPPPPPAPAPPPAGAAVNVLGSWKGTSTGAGRTYDQTLTVTQQSGNTFSGNLTDGPVTGTIQGDQVTIDRPNWGQRWTGTLRRTPTGLKMEGSIFNVSPAGSPPIATFEFSHP